MKYLKGFLHYSLTTDKVVVYNIDKYNAGVVIRRDDGKQNERYARCIKYMIKHARNILK